MPDCDWSLFAPLEAVHSSFSSIPKRTLLLSLRFTKEWEKSCDEAELFVIYKSAYAAFKKVNFTCMALWLVSLIGDIFLKIGLVPVVFVTIIWLVSLISYYREAAKLDKKQKK